MELIILMSMVDYLDELSLAIDKIKFHIDDYRNNPLVKVCLYLGIKNDDTFEYGFNCEDFYNKVNEIYKDTKVWESKTTVSYTVYSVDDEQLTMIEDHGDFYYKKKILHEYTFLYKNTPFDFQVVIFEYTKISKMPMNIEECSKMSIYKFILRNSSVGLYQSEVNGDDCIEIEQGLVVETINLDKTKNSSMYIAHDLLLRLRDTIDLCEKMTNSKLELKSHYNGITC